jgi:hypothetical protein
MLIFAACGENGSAEPSSTVTTAIAVSYKNPPPPFSPAPFASVRLSSPLQDGIGGTVAVTRAGVVVDDLQRSNMVTVVDWSGVVGPWVTLAARVSSIVVFDDVLYGLTQSGVDTSMVAIPLSGPSAGQIVRSVPVSSAAYTELPVGAFGLGPNGIVDRVRKVGTQLIGYVDAGGNPDAATVTIDEHKVVTRAGTTSWSLGIDRDPAWQSGLVGPAPAAPSIGGGAVYWTEIGGPADTTSDYPDMTLPVIAELRADGTGSWWSLPDGWHVVASDTSGTVLAKATGDGLTLARFLPHQ